MTLEELMTKTGDKRAHEDDSNVNSEDSLSLDDLRNLLLDTDAPEIFSDQQPEQHTHRASNELPAQFTTCLANMTVLSLGTPLKDESQQDSSGSQLKCILEQNGYSKRFYESVLYDIDLANHTVLLAADGNTILGGLIYTNAYVHGPTKVHFLVISAMVVARAYAQSADQIHAALLQQFIAAAKFATDATHIDYAPRVLIPSPGRLSSTYEQCLGTCGLFGLSWNAPVPEPIVRDMSSFYPLGMEEALMNHKTHALIFHPSAEPNHFRMHAIWKLLPLMHNDYSESIFLTKINKRLYTYKGLGIYDYGIIGRGNSTSVHMVFCYQDTNNPDTVYYVNSTLTKPSSMSSILAHEVKKDPRPTKRQQKSSAAYSAAQQRRWANFRMHRNIDSDQQRSL